MKKNSVLWALSAANVALAASLFVRLGGENTATAQTAQPPRRPADYIMIPGEVQSSSQAVVYIVDATNGLLGAMSYDDGQNRLDTMAPLDLSRIFMNAANPAPPPRRR